MAKKHRPSPQEAATAQMAEMVKHAYAGKKDSFQREDIKKQFGLLSLENVYRAFARKNTEKVFLKVLGLTGKQWGKIATLIKHYKTLILPSQQEERNYETIYTYFVSSLGGFANFKVSRPVNIEHAYLSTKFIDPPLECLKGDLLFFRVKDGLPTQEIQRFINIVNSKPQEYLRKVAFVLAFSDVENFIELAKKTRYKFVILSAENLKDIMLANSPYVEFIKITTRQLNLLDIQPYRTHSSTPSIMFFGRKREIDLMLDDRSISFAIYGGRQLGKTSLLRKIQEISDEDRDQKTVFVTCEGIQDNLTLGVEILKQLEVGVADVKTINDFEQTLRDYLRTQKPYHTIFIDEIDDLVDIDRKSSHKIFVSLRNINNDFRAKCRFFFAGFKKLYSEFYRLYAPFRNFAEPYELKSLGKKDAQLLIQEPLCNRLGIEFRSPKIVDRIYRYTAGHPCFIQHYCKCLIERIAEGERRLITEESIEDVYRSEAYRDLITRNYSDNFKEGEREGDVIPKLIVCQMIFDDMEACTEDELLESIKQSGVSIEAFRLRSELRKLTMTSVLERHSNMYRFTNSVYPQILKEGENIADVLIQLVERCSKLLEKQKQRKNHRKEPGEQFVLREKYLERIIADSERSYAIIGGGGTGKSSALLTLTQLYKDELSTKVAYVPCEFEDVGMLVGRILQKFDMDMEDDPEENLDMLKEFIADEIPQGRRVIILLDDVEAIAVKNSSGLKRIFEKFETLSMEFGEGFRTIATGASLLHSIVSATPFSKSIEVVRLKPLDERDSQALILRILKTRWNLPPEDETLSEIISEYTGGNPCLMEKFSEMLAQKITENNASSADKNVAKAAICETAIEEVGADPDFRQFLLELYESDWEKDQFGIVSSIIDLDKNRFTVANVTDLGYHDESSVRSQLEKLDLLGFLKRAGKSYRFSNPYYKECFDWRKQIL